MRLSYPPGKGSSLKRVGPNGLIFIYLILAGLLISGCSLHQKHSSLHHKVFSLTSESLQSGGIAFMSPSTVNRNEEDRETVAFIFADTLAAERPDIPYISLPETLGAINQAGLATDYNQMLNNYRMSGIFDRETLLKVGEASGARYLVQLKLAEFRQDSRGRFGILGMRLFQTKHANIRLFVQVWDSRNGTIAWEGVEELNLSEDTGQEKDISFTDVAQESARNLIGLLPKKLALATSSDVPTEETLVKSNP
ncbi:hypothetical protein [Marinobacterium jannaschii]|uniref:hypothetical protein n=1 Tax=Marinobacterium jannaschii TaxID=64970 RepID=UPI000489CED0|nr:hypothetical protein [Marinobacterium jannaschii]